MKVEKIRIGNKEVMPFTIPSGIVMTEVSCAEKLLREVPEIGIWTTKSIGPEPRAGNREPIFAQISYDRYVNAVGLTNPGAVEFAEKLASANLPSNKFVLASIFGKNVDEFVFVAETLEDKIDGFELNLSCPHCEKVGIVLGQDPKIVGEITKAVVERTKKPIFAKLTPNTDKIEGGIGIIARAAMESGAYGISAINTIGPFPYEFDGFPVLTNKVGGESGSRIRNIGIQRVREISDAVGDVPIIAMGGISTAIDVRAYAKVGARAFGIGTFLIGMNDAKIKTYFSWLIRDLEKGSNNAFYQLGYVDMSYKKFKIKEKAGGNCDFQIFKTDSSIKAFPGQFVFAWIPGVGEKPFSVMDDEPLTLGILERGQFTKAINSLKEGDSFYIRGPYGQGVDVPVGSDAVLVGGGCGIAALYLLAKRFSKKAKVHMLLGAEDKAHIPSIAQLVGYGTERIDVATEDNSLGNKGLVTDLFKDAKLRRGSYFFNCGPKAMVQAVLPLELKVSSPKRIYSSVDYITRCGVGICGSCADEKGRRTCINGPFLNP